MKLSITRTIDDLTICEPYDVYPVVEESRLLAKKVAQNQTGTLLDMGTGTGYIGIYLAKHGWSVTLSDINPEAISIANKNARCNGVSLKAAVSNLFENIPSKFDTIVFALPNIIPGSRLMKLTQFLVGKLLHNTLGAFYEKWDYRFFSKTSFHQRKGLVIEFLKACPDHLEDNGKVYLLLFDIDLNKLVKPICYKVSMEVVEETLVNPANSYYLAVLQKRMVHEENMSA